MSDTPCTLPPVACDLLATIPADRKSQFDAIEFRGETGGGTHGKTHRHTKAYRAAVKCATDLLAIKKVRARKESK